MRGWVGGGLQAGMEGEDVVVYEEQPGEVAGGGRVHMGMEGEDVVVYEEQPGEVVTAFTHAPFLHNITHCSPPIHGQVCYSPSCPPTSNEVSSPFPSMPLSSTTSRMALPPFTARYVKPSQANASSPPSPLSLTASTSGWMARECRVRINQRMDLHIRMGVDHFELWDVSKITYLHDPVRSIQVISERIYQWMDLHICMGVDLFELWDVSKITYLHDPVRSIQVISERIYQWMDLHIRMGVDHFSLYDVGGVDPQLRALIAVSSNATHCCSQFSPPLISTDAWPWTAMVVTPSSCSPPILLPTHLQPLLDGGIAEVTDFRDLVNYESWYHGQVMIVNECVYRFRRLSKWIMYLDFDEFMFIDGQERMPTPLSVNHFLMPYEGMPYVTHGSLWWDLDRCLPSQGPDEPRWPLERMLWHGPGVFCKARDNHTKPTMCLDHYGHRKLFVDPRRVRAVMNHVVQEPTIGGGGADLSTDVLRHHHFHGIIRQGIKECTLIMKEHDNITWWSRGREEADRMQYVRTHPLDMQYLVAAHRVSGWLVVGQRQPHILHVRPMGEMRGGGQDAIRAHTPPRYAIPHCGTQGELLRVHDLV
ncbi:unnamed protein product [Closterium sp. Naga37s-1]|nr:unnamed protein product [Closterium sp. Naga37s-1]